MNLVSANAKLVIKIETKNSEQSDSEATTLATFSDITGSSPPSTPPTKHAEGFLELFRARFQVYGDVDKEWVNVRMLGPSWQSN